jgi:NADH:ubiquinone oxidoreductase subunit F (NADH-binding)/ferredoxin
VSGPAPEVLRVGQARLTAGLDRFARIGLREHGQIFGSLRRLSAAQLIDLAESVDLRGRGGAAFPLGHKLRAVVITAGTRGGTPVVLVNGSEGEPGSAKDTMLLSRSPYLVLAGAMLACQALGGREIVIGVAGAALAQAVAAAVRAEPSLRRLARIVQVPDRFVSGEGGALVNAVNGHPPLPPGRKRLASDSGVDGRPTLLSNAETFAQLAVLGLLGPEGYASAGTPDEPGTVLLTVGGSAARPAVVEAPAGTSLGTVLDICEARVSEGVLVGGYHGAWLPAEIAYAVPVSRAGLETAGGTLGAGVVLTLDAGTCPLGEVARAAAYLAAESSGQCGPCKLGLPGVARALSAVVDGSGGLGALDTARHSAGAVRGRGACHHPDGTARFVLSALDAFPADLAAHLSGRGCGRPVRGVLPLPGSDVQRRLVVDWTRCAGHGLCGRLVPELVQLDRQGYPAILDMPVPFWLERDARQAVAMCPALALRVERGLPAALPPGPGRGLPAPGRGPAGRLTR